MSQRFEGSCHCKAIAFELEADLTYLVDCNCSVCRRKGALWHGATDAQLTITQGEDALSAYQFLTKTATHYFCKTCGVHPFVRPRLNPKAWAVNIRCIDEVDLASLPVIPFDGHNWEEAAKAYYARQRSA